MSYHYQPLKRKEIRLLKLISATPEQLSFGINHVSSLKKRKYVALSYQWGEEAPPDEKHKYNILLNECRVEVRPNLLHALQQISKSKWRNQYLWVDAVCINQQSNAEKSIQITRMRDIFDTSVNVLVWLGKPKDDEQSQTNNKLAFDLIEYLFGRVIDARAEKIRSHPRWGANAKTLVQHEVDALRTILPASDRNIWDVPGSRTYNAWLGIIAVWKSGFWERTWVYQEATVYENQDHETYEHMLLSGKVQFLFGDQRTNRRALLIAGDIALRIQYTTELNTSILEDATASCILMDTLANELHYRGDPLTFLELLHLFRHTSCTNLHDKVYAPLCLAPGHVRQIIKPDYEGKTFLEVCIDVVEYHLSRPAWDLAFLGNICNHPEAAVGETSEGNEIPLPSWLPNWSDQINIPPLPKALYIQKAPSRPWSLWTKKTRMQPTYCPLSVAASRPYIDWEFALCVSGVFIDVVIDRSRETEKTKLQRWTAEMQDTYFTGESFSDAMERTVVVDVEHNEYGRPSWRGGRFDLSLWQRPHDELDEEEKKQLCQLGDALDRVSLLRRLGLSKKGYLLKVLMTVTEGDMLWALEGGAVLYILRPVQGNPNDYTFMGECYAHGLMDGEIDRWIRMGRAKKQPIRLV